MANIKSAKKRVKVIRAKTLRNKMIKSSVKTAIRKVYAAAQDRRQGRSTEGFISCNLDHR